MYCAIESYDVLKKALDDKLREYNESNAVMNLVLFQQVGLRVGQGVGCPKRAGGVLVAACAGSCPPLPPPPPCSPSGRSCK